MHLLVTGGAGYIGSHAMRLFLERGHEAWALDNLSRGHPWAVPAGRLIRGDIADRQLVERVLRERHIEAVVHFAALALVGESVLEPERYYQNNLVGTLALLEAMRSTGINQIVFSSTCAVYGDPTSTPIAEVAPTLPVNPYGRAKLAVEWALADYASAHGLAFAALRYFNAAGAHHSGTLGEEHDPEMHLIPLLLQSALGKRGPISVYGSDYATPDGTCIRDYIHVEDLAEAHLLALSKLQPGKGLTVNLGTGSGHSVREVIAACAAVTGRAILVREAARRAGDPPVLVADASRARSELGWSPRYGDLREIIETAWRWHSNR
jgi:UDP-glucose 4-epimerase